MSMSKGKIERTVSGISLIVKCETCEKYFQIGMPNAASHVVHKKKYDTNGRSIFLTYYDCPKCGRRHYAQVDDNRTLGILKENQRMFIKLAAKRAKGKPIPKSQSDKYKKRTKHLRDCRMELMKEFTGVMLHDDETDTSFELRFSV